MRRTPTQALTVAHGLPERFGAHALAPDGARLWSFAPPLEATLPPQGIDAIVTDLRTFEQRRWSLEGALDLTPSERVYQCSCTVLAPPESAPIIVLVAMSHHHLADPKRRRAHVARIDTARGALRVLWCEPVSHASDRPVIDALGDHSAFCVRHRAAAPAVFTADGERSSDPLLLDAFGPYDDRCALTRWLRARVDGRSVLIEDLRTGERRNTAAVLPLPAPATLRALDARHALLSVTGPTSSLALVDARTLVVRELPRAGRVAHFDSEGVVSVPRQHEPIVLVDLARDAQRSVPTASSAFVGASRESVVLQRAGRFETISRATGSIEDRQTSDMGSIARVMVSDHGAVCAQDLEQRVCWWNERADRRCDSESLPAELARAARIEQWIDGEETLLVSRTRAERTTLAGLGWSEVAPIERWSFEVAHAEAVASDRSGRRFAVFERATQTLALYDWDGVRARCVARSAQIERFARERDPRRPSSSIAVHLHDAAVIELVGRGECALFEQRGDALERVASRAAYCNPFETQIAPTLEQLREIELDIGRLLPSAPALPHFEAQPTRRSLSAQLAEHNGQSGGPANIAMTYKGFVWIPRATFAAIDRVTALSIAPNARWGAIGTRRGLVLRFSIEPHYPRPTHRLR